MKRDLDLCLTILKELESAPPSGPIGKLGTPDDPIDANVTAHISLMIDGCLLSGEASPNSEEHGGGSYIIREITWNGHEFLSAAQEPAIWGKAKERAKKVGSWTFSLILEILKDEAKRQAGPFLGTE